MITGQKYAKYGVAAESLVGFFKDSIAASPDADIAKQMGNRKALLGLEVHAVPEGNSRDNRADKDWRASAHNEREERWRCAANTRREWCDWN